MERAKARLARVPEILKQFRQSVLAAATDGRLTDDWRAINPTQSNWSKVEFGDLTISARTGLDRGSKEQGEDKYVAYFKMNNISNDGRMLAEQMIRVDASEQEISMFLLSSGDFLFNTRNSKELVGKTCVFVSPANGEQVIYNNNILRVRFNENTHADYVNFWFCSPLGRAELEKLKSATTSVAAIYQSRLMTFLIPLPSIREQLEIVRRVETFFALADRIEARYQAISEKVDKLTQSLLAKAFRGELVPQDPNDEPASVLLDRIRAARAELPSKRARGRKIVTA